MPIKIPDHLPAKEILEREDIFVMPEARAFHQDIRSLRIVILNLMPVKETAETQILRLLGNTPLQVDISFLRMKTHRSKNTSHEHLKMFYRTIEDLDSDYYDGMIVTGAPIEHLPFESIGYWEEFQQIMDWRAQHVTSTLYICWAAMAALYHQFGVAKRVLNEKLFGVFDHQIRHSIPLVRGFDETFYVPHSRYATLDLSEIESVSDIEVIADSPGAGLYMLATRDGRQIYVTGHPEYDLWSLHEEYERDASRGVAIALPQHYYPGDDPTQRPLQNWRSHASLLFANWLNYYVYQETPYDLGQSLRS